MANLTRTHLSGTNLSYANLSRARINGAFIGHTVFGNTDLSVIKGLEAVGHLGPSVIGIDTIYLSKGDIPEIFLRGAGVPHDFITYMRALTARPIEFYSCFISYSSKN